MATNLEIARMHVCQKCDRLAVFPALSTNGFCLVALLAPRLELTPKVINGVETGCPLNKWKDAVLKDYLGELAAGREARNVARAERTKTLLTTFAPDLAADADLQAKLDAAVIDGVLSAAETAQLAASFASDTEEAP